MATCPCASAQAPTLPDSLDLEGEAAVDPTPTLSPASLALRAIDEADNLHEVQQAYAGLELLLAPVGVDECEDIQATRSELSALLRLVNEALGRRIDCVDDALRTVHEALLDLQAAARLDAPEAAEAPAG